MAAEDVPICKRLKRRENPRDIRFVTFSCQRRLPLLKNPTLADLFIRSLAEARERCGFELFAHVVMPEHVHLLLRPSREGTLDRALLSLKLSVAQRAIRRWKELNAAILDRIDTADGPRFWQKGGGFDRNVRGGAEFSKHVHYIHQNPVTRGLVPAATDWPWSSVHQWLARWREKPCPPGAPCDPPPDRNGGWSRWRGFMDWPE